MSPEYYPHKKLINSLQHSPMKRSLGSVNLIACNGVSSFMPNFVHQAHHVLPSSGKQMSDPATTADAYSDYSQRTGRSSQLRTTTGLQSRHGSQPPQPMVGAHSPSTTATGSTSSSNLNGYYWCLPMEPNRNVLELPAATDCTIHKRTHTYTNILIIATYLCKLPDAAKTFIRTHRNLKLIRTPFVLISLHLHFILLWMTLFFCW